MNDELIPYSKQYIFKKDFKFINDVLKSKFLTQGPMVPKFEQRIKKIVNSKYAVSVNSATSGLHISCLALNLTSGQILWTSPISFVASANCGLFCGAKVDLIDIELENYNLDRINNAFSL